jgi:cell division protein DivIC
MRQNKKTMIGIILVVVALMAVLLVMSRRLQTRIQAGQEEISSLSEQTEQENQRTEDINSLQEELQSDSYKEEYAKEKLGLIKDGEIIFRESDGSTDQAVKSDSSNE